MLTKLLRLLVVAFAFGLLSLVQMPSRVSAEGYDVDAVSDVEDRKDGDMDFRAALDRYGRWIEHLRFGLVWSPDSGEDPDWRPYTRGRWVMTSEYGWYWESDEPFGEVVYHYGRWFLDPEYGWIWVPGRVWGPAWVAWRESDEAVGWAPLPPEAAWLDDEGPYETDYAFYDAPRYAPLWVFVPPAYLIAHHVYRHAFPHRRNVHFFGRSRYVTHYSRRGRFVFNKGVNPRFVARATGRAVPFSAVRPRSDFRRDHMRSTPFAGRGPANVVRPSERSRSRFDSRSFYSGREARRTEPPRIIRPMPHRAPTTGVHRSFDRGGNRVERRSHSYSRPAPVARRVAPSPRTFNRSPSTLRAAPRAAPQPRREFRSAPSGRSAARSSGRPQRSAERQGSRQRHQR